LLIRPLSLKSLRPCPLPS
jgi:hypothetical protein